MKTDNELIEDFWISQGGKPNHSADLWFYESDWNMIMPLVEKIEDLTSGNKAVGNLMSMWTYYDQIFNGTINTDIAVAYELIVEFIKWYNNQKP